MHEWYRTDDTYARDIASAQKSVLSLLVGRAITEGFIGIDTLVDDVLGSGWTPHGQLAAVTVRHLLTMTSGLDDRLALVAAPGTGWLYSGAFAQLFAVLSLTTGRDVDDLASEWLFEPAGADGAVFDERRLTSSPRSGCEPTARTSSRSDSWSSRGRNPACRTNGSTSRSRQANRSTRVVRVSLVAERSGVIHVAGPGTARAAGITASRPPPPISSPRSARPTRSSTSREARPRRRPAR